jgi:outer membrane lipoprotein SlyB
MGKAISGQAGAAIGAIGGAVAGAVIGDQLGEYANPSPVHVVPLRDEEAAFIWQLQQTEPSQWVWQLCLKET